MKNYLNVELKSFVTIIICEIGIFDINISINVGNEVFQNDFLLTYKKLFN